MKKMIKIQGMTCMHCVRHVEEALKEISGVLSVSVNLKEKNALVEVSQELEDAVLKAAVEEAGYEVLSIENI